MPDQDFIQRLREALPEIVDSHPDIIAITGRDTENIVAWNPEAIVETPVIAYLFVTANELAADGDTRDPLFQFSASGETEAQANQLLGVLERILTRENFLSLTPPLDVFVVRRLRRGFNLDVYLRASRAYPVAA